MFLLRDIVDDDVIDYGEEQEEDSRGEEAK